MRHLTKKIILAEDNQADVELTKLAFQAQDIKIEMIHCPDGHALLELLPKIPLSEISYILLDLNMPRVGGIEVLKAVSRNPQWCKIPIIVFTSSMHSADVMSCYNLGANAYVLKPIDFTEFDRTIRSIHEFWGTVNVKPICFEMEVESEN